MKNKKYVGGNWLFTKTKNHYCLTCNEKLEAKRISKIVNSNSPEAKDYDFSLGDTFLVGDVEFVYEVFYCSKCDKQYSLQEIRKMNNK